MLDSRFLAFALLSTLLLLSACSSKEERVDKYFAAGLVLLEQKNYPKASLAFKNVLQIRPKYAEARYQLGLAEEKQENWRAAFGNYRAAVELSNTLIPPRIRLAELYLLAKRTGNASELANEILTITPNHPGGLALRGGIFSISGDKKSAITDAEKAVSIDPANIAAVTLLSSMYFQRGKEMVGIATLEKGVALNPDDISLKLILSKKYAVVKQNDNATKLLRQLIEIEPNVPLHRVRMADFHVSIGQIEAAEEALRNAIKENPGNANLKLVLSEFLVKRRGEKSAEETLQLFIAASPEEYRLRFGLAKLYNRQQEIGKLKGVYESIIEMDSNIPAQLKAKSQLAGVYLGEKKYDKALQLVEEVLIENPADQQALFNRGALFLKKENLPSAIADFRTLLRTQPNSVLALSSLAKAHAINNELDLAKDYFKKAINIEIKNSELHLELAKVLALLNDKKSALESINQSLSLASYSMEALKVKAQILMSQSEWKQATKVVMLVQQKHANSSLGFYFHGLVYVGQKKYEQAVMQFKKALIIASDDTKVLTDLVKVRFATKDYSLAFKDINQYLLNNPLDYKAFNLLGDVYLAQKSIKLAEESFFKAKEINAELPDAYRNLARIYIYKKQPEKAVEILDIGAKSSGENIGLLLDLAGLYENRDNVVEAIKVYDAILEKRPGVIQAVNNLAMLLIRHNQPGDLNRANDLVKAIESVQNPLYQDTVGWVKFKYGDVEGALQHIQIAAQAVPDNAEISYHLGMVYQKRGNAALAKKHLETAIASPQQFSGKDEAKSTLAAL